MKKKLNLIQLNIENLTSLWKEASHYNNSFTNSLLFNYSAIENRSWPNRLWFKEELELNTILLAKKIVLSNTPKLIIPYWDIYHSNSNQLLEQNGFVNVFDQIGMSLKNNNLFEEQQNVKIRPVISKNDAIFWSQLFTLSFGYDIHSDTIINTYRNIEYYIVYHKNKAIGTAIVYKTNNITGLHSVGIIPEARRKGFANELMKILLNIAVKNKSEYTTLQTSNMGKGLYSKLGFKEQFQIKNYTL